MTLHEIRERFMEQSRMRSRRAGTVRAVGATSFNKDFTPRGEFAADIHESVGGLAALLGGAIGGRMGAMVEGQRAEITRPEDVWERLPEGAKALFEYLNIRLIQPIVGNDVPSFGYYHRQDSIKAFTRGEAITWNLANNEGMVRILTELSQDRERLRAELQKGEHSQLWRFIETLAHESQHLSKFEEPGDHTHHAEDKIEGYEDKGDPRFGMRMGRAFDQLLSDLDDDVLGEFSRSPTEMGAFVEESK